MDCFKVILDDYVFLLFYGNLKIMPSMILSSFVFDGVIKIIVVVLPSLMSMIFFSLSTIFFVLSVFRFRGK